MDIDRFFRINSQTSFFQIAFHNFSMILRELERFSRLYPIVQVHGASYGLLSPFLDQGFCEFGESVTCTGPTKR